MCSDLKTVLLAVIVFLGVSCSSTKMIQRIRSGEIRMDISVPDDQPEEIDEPEVIIDSIRSDLSEGPIIMNAIRDSETGEMVATDVINASTVVARFRNVAERSGHVSIGFDVAVPSEMLDSRWQLKLRPVMRLQDDTIDLEPLYITGEGYRKGQLRGYQRYRDFLASIITDTTDMVRIGQLEIFLQRHYPETYAMKNDTSLVPDPVAENLFGVTQADALRHYTRHMRVYFNQKRKARIGRMYERYVKDPIVTDGVRLDTVITASDGGFIYRYSHTFRSRPGLKKAVVSLTGEIFEEGRCIQTLPFPEELTYYISSLSAMADTVPKYRIKVLERYVYDNTKALIDFTSGSHVIDTSLSDNASELRRVVRCIGDVVARREFILDSLVVKASCSPEGSFSMNSQLASLRSKAVIAYIEDYIPDQWRDSVKASHMPENWGQLRLIVANDTLISADSRKKILSITGDLKRPDEVEMQLSQIPEYRYLREKVYPQLRSVSFDFHLHRAGMQKDTVHTAELDTVYMAGLQALRNLDYRTAVEKLRPYRDYNTALAFMTADYNHSALDVLNGLDDRNAKVCYLKALILARLGVPEEAMKYYELCLTYDPYMRYRANLDPEMSDLIKRINLK